MFLSKKINILSLGDDVAISLGQNPEKIRLINFNCYDSTCAQQLLLVRILVL